uniref:Malate dehydrogenase n=1 Tax=Ciona savignyi TaxID=51511 RepID=H2Y422_CIOSA
FQGFSFTNTTPAVFIPRTQTMALGTNAISSVAPSCGGDSFALDMSTSTVAYGKVEVADRKGETIPNGWGADAQGRETNDPTQVLNGGGLLPLGGSEISGGYKGYGLAMMVEVMCGILAGAHYGKNVRKWGTTERIADLGQCFIAVDPKAFHPGFEDRLQDFLDAQRNLDPSDPQHPVLVAGDPERIHMKKCDNMGGIPYPKNVVDYMNGVAEKLGVGNMETVKPE